jgi:hypothetical protein
MNPNQSQKTNRYRLDCKKTLPINDQGYRCCRYCGASVRPPKRTFCSPKCVHEYRLRSSGNYLRRQVYLRDRGICAVCKLDTKKLAKQLAALSPDDPARNFLLRENLIHPTRVESGG